MNTGKRSEIRSKLTIKTRERGVSRIFVVNFEHISHIFLVFQLLTLKNKMLAGYVVIS